LEAVLAGTAAFIAEARRYKHMFAGAMRQAGIAAAGCLYALDHHVERLQEDHALARRLAEGLGRIPGIIVKTPRPETNMVFFEVVEEGWSNAEFLEQIANMAPIALAVDRGLGHDLDWGRRRQTTAFEYSHTGGS
jgi:threonine aldolase